MLVDLQWFIYTAPVYIGVVWLLLVQASSLCVAPPVQLGVSFLTLVFGPFWPVSILGVLASLSCVPFPQQHCISPQALSSKHFPCRLHGKLILVEKGLIKPHLHPQWLLTKVGGGNSPVLDNSVHVLAPCACVSCLSFSLHHPSSLDTRSFLGAQLPFSNGPSQQNFIPEVWGRKNSFLALA